MLKKIILLIILLPFVIFSQDNKSATDSLNYRFQKQTVRPIDFTKYKEITDIKDAAVPPLFKDCKDSIDNSICTRKNIQDFIVQNFDKKLVTAFVNRAIIPKPSARIFIYITIDKQGKISNIDAISKYPSFAREAKRVLSTIPELIPAKNKNGEKIAVRYLFAMIVHHPGNANRTIDFFENMVTHKDCHFDDQLQNSNCLNNALRRAIQRWFNPNNVIDKHTCPGRYRIIVSFEVGKKGEISITNSKIITKNISKKMSIAFKNEAIKTIKKISYLKPADNLGKPRNSNYSLPITFVEVD